MNTKKIILSGLLAALIATVHADFETAYFRGNIDHTGEFPALSGSAPKRLKWKFQTGAPVVSSPVLSGGTVFFGSLDGFVYAISAATGTEIWKYDTGTRVSGSAAVADGIVYIASENGRLYALDAATGALQWDRLMESSRRPAGSPVVFGDRVYICYGGNGGYNTIIQSTGKAAGLDRNTGTPVWLSSGSASQGYESPIIYSNTLISSYGRESYAAYPLAVSNGTPVWTQSRQSSYGSQFAGAALADDKLFVVGTIAGSLHAIQAGTGARLWTVFVDPQQQSMQTGGKPGNEVLTAPAVSGGRVFIGSQNGKFLCYSAGSGALLWTLECGSPIHSSPSVADGTVYFGSHDGKLRAVNATNGVERWNYDAGARISSSPWIDGNEVYFGCHDGAVYCLGEQGVLADTDGDGLPDWWEEQYFGGATNANSSATAANGINTVMECYIADLNPTDPAALFLMSDLRPLTSGNILTWNAASGRVYSVYWTSNLLSGFQLLESNVAWTPGAFTDVAHAAEVEGFYRIKVRLE